MSQQLQITGGAKVRSLEGVITGSTGVLGSLPINGSNGIPQLDVNGKILVSQLPNSVMEYLGTWNAATNTPTLVNGTGNAGDVYLCNVAGTVNFGAGPITFGVGDQVIYSGTIWQKASGSTGTVTSVAVTETGDALTITGSPITTSGTINIGFAGTSAQYVAGDGTLVTFPTITTEAQRLITEVYNQTGATLTKGTVVYINGGHGNLPTVTKAIANSDATSAQTYGVVQTDIGNNNNGFVVVIGSLMDLDTQAYANGTQLYLSSTVAGAWTSTKQYAPAHLVYVAIVTRSHPTQGVVEVRIQNGFELDELHDVSAQTPSNNQGIFYNSSTSLWENKSIATALGYTPANAADLSNYVTLATSQVITGAKVFDGSAAFSATGGVLGIEGGASVYKGLALAKGFPPSIFVAGFSTLYSASGNNNAVFNDNSNTSKLQFQASSSYTYTFPANTGTVALTSDIPSVTNFVTLNTLQTIIGTKIYSSLQYFDNNVYIKHGISGSSTNYTTLGANASGLNINLASGTSNNSLNFASTSTSNTYTFPNATGTVALTSDLSGYISGSGSSGRIPYFNGTNSVTSTANLNWDNSNNFITTSGVYVYNNTTNAYLLTSNGDNVGTVFNVSATRWGLGYSLSPSTLATAALSWNSEGRVSIGNTNNTYNLDVTGTIRNTTSAYFATSNGDVAIGTTTAINYSGYNTLTINGNTNGGVLAIRNPNANGINISAVSSLASIDAIGASTPIVLNTAAVERMRITSAGNVGIGTSSPVYPFVVKVATNRNWAISASGSGFASFRAGDDGYNNFNRGEIDALPLLLNSQSGGNVGIGTTSPSQPLHVYATSTTTSSFFETNSANSYIGLKSTSGICYIGNVSYAMTFETGGSERMRITSGGVVLINSTTSPNSNHIFYVNGSNFSMGVNASSGGTGAENMRFYNAGTAVGTISTSATSTQFNTTSDYRLKQDFKDYNGLDLIKLIKTYNFEWKADNSRMYGVIAHELSEVLDYVVQGKKDGKDMQSVDYSKLVPILVKAIQELKAEIDELKNK